MTLPTITEIKFTPIHRKEFNGKRSLVGFVAFLYDSRLLLKDIAVHELRELKEGLRFRLVYPKDVKDKVMFHPIDKATQEHIDRQVCDYLKTETVTKQEVQHELPTRNEQPS